METLVIEIPDKEVKVVKEILKKFNIKFTKAEVSSTPNELTLNTIKDARDGKNIGDPIKNVREFVTSL